MTESQYYHSALERALLNGKAVKERIDARIAVAPVKEKKSLRISPRLIIALAAAATLLIASVTYAAVLLRNQAFKEQTNAVLEERIETVTQPLNPETREGWQPNHVILFDNVVSTEEIVRADVADGAVFLQELWSHGESELWAHFKFEPTNREPFRITDLAASVNGTDCRKPLWADPFDSENGAHDGDRYFAYASFAVSQNPFLPGATFVFTGKVNDEPFTLTYTFTEATYRRMQQSVLDAVTEHQAIVDAIPDEGTEVNYQRDNQTLLEVAVKGNRMYFTVASDGTMSTMDRPYGEYDSGMWPVVDGRISEFYYLGNVDQQYPEGSVYSTVLPYTEDMRPDESLISYFSIVFRYEWATGKVTVPKDEEEYTAWRKESMELSKPYCEEDWTWHFDAKGESFSVTDLVFHNRSLNGIIGVVLSSDTPFEARQSETAEEAPIVTINGVRLVHLGEVDPLESLMAGLSKDRCKKGYQMVGAAVADLPETFTLSVTYQGETVEVTLQRDDVVKQPNAQTYAYYDEVFGY